MKAFEMTRPSNPAEAVQQLGGAAGANLALGGGQDLLALLKDRVLEPDRIVNLKSLPGLRGIETAGGSLQLGALVTLDELTRSEAARSGWPMLVEAAGAVGTPQIRNLGTVGGNLCQQPRCWYYRYAAFDCHLTGGTGCPAVPGDNRHHAIFGGGPCANAFAASLAFPLQAYGATVRVQGPGGERTVAVADLYPDPAAGSRSVTTLAGDEIILGVTVPSAAGWQGAHREVRFRQSVDWPAASATVLLQIAGGNVADARIVLGSVSPRPHVPTAAEEALRGKPLTAPLAAAAAQVAVADAQPLSGNGYKVALTRNLLRRTILAAAGMEGA